MERLLVRKTRLRVPRELQRPKQSAEWLRAAREGGRDDEGVCRWLVGERFCGKRHKNG